MLSEKQIKTQQREQLTRLIDWMGGNKSRLARELGVTYQAVYFWIERGRISATAAILLEQKTKGLFKKEDMRPDVTEWQKG